LRFDSWDSFLAGGEARRVPVALYHPDKTRIEGTHSAWDLSLHAWGDETYLYAGVMTPTGRRRQARWPQDNWTRRVYAFHRQGRHRWVRDSRPLFGEVPRVGGWIDHSYGHHFIEDEDGVTWVFYERVVEEGRCRRGYPTPHVTEIFARKMITPCRADDEEIPILDVGSPPYPTTRRRAPHSGEPNGFLIEGPRPTRVVLEDQVFYLLGFSAGDFPTDRYGIHLAWSRHVLGPYLPLLESSPHGLDMADLGREIRQRYGLSWGPARPSFFADPSGAWWLLFHAVRKELRPDTDYSNWPQRPLGHFHRNIYLAPVRIALGESGHPTVHIVS
jgi:hypothetical protein